MKATKNYGLSDSLIDSVIEAMKAKKKEDQIEVGKKEVIDVKPKTEGIIVEGVEDRLARAKAMHALRTGKTPKKAVAPKSNITSVSGSSYGGSAQKDEPEAEEDDAPKKSIKKGSFKRRFNTKAYESVEQSDEDGYNDVNELSRKTLKGYIKKAEPAARDASGEEPQVDPKSGHTYRPTYVKRVRGINRAISSLKKESVEQSDGSWMKDSGWKKSETAKKDKSGAIHTPASRVKHLAKMAMKMKKQEK